MLVLFKHVISLFVSFSSQIQSKDSDLNTIPKSALDGEAGLGIFVGNGVFCKQYFLSSALLVSVEKHNRNTLKDTKVPAVPAIRTGQDQNSFGISIGPAPDGWETQKSDYRFWNKAVIIAARLLQSTMSIHLFHPNPYHNLKSEYRKETELLLIVQGLTFPVTDYQRSIRSQLNY